MAYPFSSYQNPYQMYYSPYPQQLVQQQPVQQPQQQNQPTYYTGRIWVNNRGEADSYPVAPNNAVDLWDRNGTVLYQKKADATGRPSVSVFDVVERTETASDDVPSTVDKVSAYATKDELSAVLNVVKGFDEAIGSIKTDIDTMKGDMYGIAGKKKISRSKEVAEDDE